MAKVTEPTERFDGEMPKTAWLRAVEETRKSNPGLSTTAVLQKTRRDQPKLFSDYQSVGGSFSNDPPWEPAGNY